jgi:hypothetical protein
MPHYQILSCTCTRTGGHNLRLSLALAHGLDATLSDLPQNNNYDNNDDDDDDDGDDDDDDGDDDGDDGMIVMMMKNDEKRCYQWP